METAILLKLIDGAFLLFQAGINRELVVSKVNDAIDKGATPDQVAEMLQDERVKSELAAQAAIDAKK